MNEHDIINFLGFPDKINPIHRPMSIVWYCSKCGKARTFKALHTLPTDPCSCGSIFWQTKEKV